MDFRADTFRNRVSVGRIINYSWKEGREDRRRSINCYKSQHWSESTGADGLGDRTRSQERGGRIRVNSPRNIRSIRIVSYILQFASRLEPLLKFALRSSGISFAGRYSDVLPRSIDKTIPSYARTPNFWAIAPPPPPPPPPLFPPPRTGSRKMNSFPGEVYVSQLYRNTSYEIVTCASVNQVRRSL